MNQCVQENISDTVTEDSNNPGCTHRSMSSVTAYYCVFSILWGIGWASTKISHMSMVPALSTSENNRMALNSISYAINVVSVICLCSVSWLFVRTGENYFLCVCLVFPFLVD